MRLTCPDCKSKRELQYIPKDRGGGAMYTCVNKLCGCAWYEKTVLDNLERFCNLNRVPLQ